VCYEASVEQSGSDFAGLKNLFWDFGSPPRVQSRTVGPSDQDSEQRARRCRPSQRIDVGLCRQMSEDED
jgi:hypothetical protein